ERVAFEGKTVRTRGFRLVSPPPAPVPIYVGALMPPMLELAGEVADGVVLNFLPVDAVPRMLAHVRAGAERAGRDPATLEVVARFQTVVTDDAPAARDAIRQMMGPYFATSVYNRFIAWCGFPEEARAIDTAWRTKDRARNVAAVTDEMVDRLAIIGSAEHCRARLAGFAAAGVTTPMIQPFLFDEAATRRSSTRRSSSSTSRTGGRRRRCCRRRPPSAPACACSRTSATPTTKRSTGPASRSTSSSAPRGASPSGSSDAPPSRRLGCTPGSSGSSARGPSSTGTPSDGATS